MFVKLMGENEYLLHVHVFRIMQPFKWIIFGAVSILALQNCILFYLHKNYANFENAYIYSIFICAIILIILLILYVKLDGFYKTIWKKKLKIK